MKADQEAMLPGLAFAGAAAVGGSILVNRVRKCIIFKWLKLLMAIATPPVVQNVRY
jgi:hypothetical protein